jgi:Cerato-platanin
MQIIAAALILASVVPSLATRVAYDNGYDDGSRSLNAVACSDGNNGLIQKYGWTTQGQISSFPRIGASDAIQGWNSPNVSLCIPHKLMSLPSWRHSKQMCSEWCTLELFFPPLGFF